MKNSLLLLLLLTLAAVPVASQTTVGSLYEAGDTFFNTSSPPVMFVDLVSPATAAGSVNTATVWWSSAPACAASFRIKFFRPVLTDTSVGENYNLVATRGPFDSQPLVARSTTTMWFRNGEERARQPGHLHGILHSAGRMGPRLRR